MKKILIVLDGLMEDKFDEMSFKELVLGDIDVNFKEEIKNFSVKGKDVDSLNCIMNILGYNSNKVDIGERAFYEGLNRGITINENQSILRCNVVKVKNGILEDFTGGNLPEDIGDILKRFNLEYAKLYPCCKYKNLLVLDDYFEDKLYPPHFNIGKRVSEISPKKGVIKNIMDESYEFFKKEGFEGLMLWPWGVSKNVKLNPLKEKVAVISGIDLVLGIGKALKMEVIKPEGATGDFDTNLSEKLEASMSLIKKYDYLFIHINGFDELAHRKDFKGKMEFIEKVKKEFLVLFVKNVDKYNDVSIYITSDHRTDSFTGKHEEKSLPLIIITS